MVSCLPAGNSVCFVQTLVDGAFGIIRCIVQNMVGIAALVRGPSCTHGPARDFVKYAAINTRRRSNSAASDGLLASVAIALTH